MYDFKLTDKPSDRATATRFDKLPTKSSLQEMKRAKETRNESQAVRSQQLIACSVMGENGVIGNKALTLF